MGSQLYWYWAIAEMASAYFLLQGINDGKSVIGFVTSHSLAAFLTYAIFLALSRGKQLLRQKVATRDFRVFLLAVAFIPLVGPASGLFLSLFLRFYPIYPVRIESYEKVNREIMLVFQKKFEGRSLPVVEALLIKGVSRADSLRMVGILDELGWSSTKSALLRYVIRLSPFQSVVLMAIDMFTRKMAQILSEAAHLEESKSASDAAALVRLAGLYHEIVYLDLCEPAMKSFYLRKACAHALAAFTLAGNEEAALLSVKYLLEADRVEEARKVYESFRQKGDYFFPKWITYEFELSFRMKDMETFGNLSLLIESAGGVFVPEKVKEAARTWMNVLTSAWL